MERLKIRLANGGECYCQTKRKPLWHHKRGLQQTASGYGHKLATDKMLLFAGKWRRIYVRCFSNNGTAYVIVDGNEAIVE